MWLASSLLVLRDSWWSLFVNKFLKFKPLLTYHFLSTVNWCCLSTSIAKSKFSDQLFVNKITQSPNILKFHPYEPHLSVISKSSIRWAATPINTVCIRWLYKYQYYFRCIGCDWLYMTVVYGTWNKVTSYPPFQLVENYQLKSPLWITLILMTSPFYWLDQVSRVLFQ